MNASDQEFQDDVTPEEETEVGPGLVKSLRDKLKKAVEEKQEYLDGWQRSRADFANYKREEASMHTDKEDRIKAEFVESLLPGLDALEMALKHTSTKELEIVAGQMQESLKKLGIEKIGKVGEELNHHIHEVLSPGDGEIVKEVLRSGYKVGEKIIRPAQVII